MSGKVKVTKEQAEAIEELKDEIATKLWNMPQSFILQAMHIGYEVEPEFKRGDFITYEWDRERFIGEIKNHIVVWNDDTNCPVEYIKDMQDQTTVRHATPSEIAEEKERRWWKKHGREVWQLKKHDILRDGVGNAFEVNSFHGNGVRQKVIFKPGHFDLMTNVKGSYIVVCFAEKRLDVKTNE